MIHDDHRLLFVPIPRCASTAVRIALGLSMEPGHPTAAELSRRYPRRFRDYTTFAVIRSPFDRLRSCYQYARMEVSRWHPEPCGEHPDKAFCQQPFRDVVMSLRHGLPKHEGWRPQAEWVTQDGAVIVDELVPINRLAMWLHRRGVTGMVKANVSEDERLVFDAEMQAVVREVYGSGLELWEGVTEAAR